MPPIVTSAKALIEHNGKYLTLKDREHKGDLLDLPGGKIKYGESPEKTLTREVKEETNLDIEIIKPIGVWYFFSANSKTQVIAHTYLCKPTSDISKLKPDQNPDESLSELKWRTIDEILAAKGFTLSDSLRKLLIEFSS